MPRTRSQAKPDAKQPTLTKHGYFRTRTAPCKRIKNNAGAAIDKTTELERDSGYSTKFSSISSQIPIVRKRNNDSTNSTSSLVSHASSFQSLASIQKENIPNAGQVLNSVKSQLEAVEAVESPALPLGELNSARKRPRVEDSPPKYDFSNAELEPKKAVQQLEPYLKRVKASASPKKSPKNEDPKSEDPKNEATVTPKLSIQERIAKIKARQKEIEAKKVEKVEKEAAQPKCQETPKKVVTGKGAEIKNRLAAIRAGIEANKKERVDMKTKREEMLNRLAEQSFKSVDMATIQKHLRTLKLPTRYDTCLKQFRYLDETVLTLHNRKDTITFSRLQHTMNMRVAAMNKRFDEESLKTITGVKDDAYLLQWVKGLRMENQLDTHRIKSENYQLTVKPANLAEEIIFDGQASPPKTPMCGSDNPDSQQKWARMTTTHLSKRLVDFSKRLLQKTYRAHCRFLANLLNESIDKIGEKFPLDKLKRWHKDFKEDEHLDELPLQEFPDKPEFLLSSTPRKHVGSKECQTPLSARRLLESVKAKIPVVDDSKKGPETSQTPKRPTAKTKSLNSTSTLPLSLQKKFAKRLQKEHEDQVVREQLDSHQQLQHLRCLFDIARAVKSYFFINSAQSGLLTEIIKKVRTTASTTLSEKDALERIQQLVNLPVIKQEKTLELYEDNGTSYLKIRPRATLSEIKAGIELAIERKERALKQ